MEGVVKMLQRRIAKLGLLAAIRYRRPLLRLTASMAKNPGRTRRSVRTAILAKQLRANPKARKQLKAAVVAASAAAARARKLGPAKAANDQRILDELRAAATAMASGLAAGQAPAKKRRRIGKLVVSVGMVGAGAFAGYRAYRSRGADSSAFTDGTADFADVATPTPAPAETAAPQGPTST
jgi:hypothetical protein